MTRRVLVVLAACATVNAAVLSAQSVRGTVTSTARYIELRPIARDTVDSASVTVLPNGRLEFEGRPVFCAAETCTFYRPKAVEHAMIMTHDVALTTWGFGVEGLSGTVMLRARTEMGGDFTWPRYDDPFDAMLVYADLARDDYRVRIGRQRTASGLGFYSFDGVAALYQATTAVTVEGYAGRSLARALEQPRHEALSAVESFIPDEQAWLIGAVVEASTSAGHSGAVRYQREIWGDRAALVSERASLDLKTTALRPLQLEAAADYDVAYARVGKAHVTARVPLRDNRISVEVSGRRYLPFFELWTIWGVFSPVPYHEAELQAGWSASSRLGLAARASVRKYEDADANVFISSPRDDARLFALRGRFAATPNITIDGEARMENGFGAYIGSGELNVAWTASERFRASIYGTAFQQILEFRTGEAAVLGFGGSADYTISDRIALGAGGTVYRQRFDNRPSALDWNQKRAWASVEWRFGRDAGSAGGDR